MVYLIAAIAHALLHKRTVITHPTGARIVICGPRWTHRHHKCWFTPAWPGALAERIATPADLEARIELEVARIEHA